MKQLHFVLKRGVNIKQIRIKEIEFGSFLKLVTILSLSLGVTIGLLMFILIGFCGVGSAELNGVTLYGVKGGTAALFMATLVCVMMGLLVGIFSYWPFHILVTKILKRVSICGDFDDGNVSG